METIGDILAFLDGLTWTQWIVVVSFVAGSWFIPTFLAIFMRPRQVGKIALANIVAGLTWVSWLALIGWVLTGERTKPGSEESGPDRENDLS